MPPILMGLRAQNSLNKRPLFDRFPLRMDGFPGIGKNG